MQDLIRFVQEVHLDSGKSRADKRSVGKATKLEKKTILTFLSQGAVGGMAGYFLLTTFVVVSRPNFYNFLYLAALPMILCYGSVYGCITAVFVWLPGVLLKRRLRFVARAVIGMAAMTLLVAAVSYVTQASESNQRSWVIGFICVTGLLVGLIAGSRIKPWRLIVFGAGPPRAHHNFGSWLSIPVGFLLRVAGVLCLLEALMTLAVWLSYRGSEGFKLSNREYLPAIVLAVLYFATSTYLSFRSPRKIYLLATAILLNLPLAVWIVNLRRNATENSNSLAYLFLVFICLWAVYTLGRMIVPESALSVVNSVSEADETQKVIQNGDCSVQL